MSTSSSVDDVRFSHNGPYGVMAYHFIPKRREKMTSVTAEIPNRFCSTTKNRKYSLRVAHWGKLCYFRLSCWKIAIRNRL